jgi:hypothetical protein
VSPSHVDRFKTMDGLVAAGLVHSTALAAVTPPLVLTLIGAGG